MASPTSNGYTSSTTGAPPSPGFHHHSPAHIGGVPVMPPVYQKENRPPPQLHMTPSNSYHHSMYHPQFDEFATVKVRSGAIAVPPPTAPPLVGSSNTGTLGSTGSAASLGSASDAKFAVPSCDTKTFASTTTTNSKEDKENNKEGPTPSSTPTTSRKNRRRSNLFTPSKKSDDGGSGSGTKSGNQPEVGSGRSIPTRQGILYKKSNKSFSKEWKKKYVTLCECSGRMTYYPSLNVRNIFELLCLLLRFFMS